MMGLALVVMLVALVQPAAANSRKEMMDQLRRAMVLSASGESQQAQQLVAAAQRWGEQQQDAHVMAWAQMMHGYLEAQAERWEPASAAYQQAAQRFAQLNEQLPQATCLASLGRIYVTTGEPAKAVPVLEQAIELQGNSNQRVEVARTLANLARAHQALGQTDHSIVRWQAAQLIYDDGVQDPQSQWQVAISLAVALTEQGQLEQAQAFLEKAAALAGQDPVMQVQVAQASAAVEHQRGNLEAAIAQYRSALQLTEVQPSPNQSQMAALRNNLGSALREHGEKDIAKPHLQTALQIYRQLKDEAGTARALFNLAVLHEEMGERDQAEAAYRQVAEIRKGIGDASGAAKALENLGLLLTTAGQSEAARPLFEEARTLRGTR